MKLTGRFFLFGFLLMGPAIVSAEEIQWRPARSARTSSREFTANKQSSPVRLGRPVALHSETAHRREDNQVQQTTFRNDGQIVQDPSYGIIVRAQDTGVPPVPPPPLPGQPNLTNEPYNCAVPTDPIAPAIPGPVGGPAQGGFMGFVNTILVPTGGRNFLQSDHAFDTFSSPVTNPFYFEDPRSLTELRPVYMFQNTPGSAPFFAGGDIHTFALQGRLAITERLSFVIHRLGWISLDPNNPMGEFQQDSGFSELHIGPKYTFIRDDCTKTLLAGGLTFEIPTGSGSVFQNTGDLSLRPYISFGQEFLPTPYGTFHFLNTTGYNFAVDGERTQFFFSSFHLDFDAGNWHRIYPFVELNWFAYTVDGDVRNLDFEGRDLINFGSRDVSGHHDLAIATGARFKFTEMIQLGAGIEFPLLDRQDLMDYRLTFDLIFRY